jgi:glycosyltransferase involved in cell wall biosynthesis
MKKSLLFVIDSLECAGAEKSLVTLLSLMDYSRYSVDLMLFGHGGVLEELVPKEVNILKPLKYAEFAKQSFLKALTYSVSHLNYKMFASRIQYSIGIRKNKCSNPQKAGIYWRSVSKVIDTNSKSYDVAISYAQGIPTFYVAEKVSAKKKFAWVNVSYRLDPFEREFQTQFYDQYDKIVAVSDSTKDIFLETFPQYKREMKVIYDINNPRLIIDMAHLGNGYEDQFNGVRILTIGRLAYQKGYDFALEACKKLKDKNINFRWYALGKGPLQKEIEDYINQNGLSEHFVLLGVKSNPYPYIKQADIYVQPSRFEGFGIAIAEARMLDIPVVATRFDAVYNQMVHGKNGLIVDMNAEAISDGILQLLKNISLRKEITKNLNAEKKGNIEEIEKVYELIG